MLPGALGRPVSLCTGSDLWVQPLGGDLMCVASRSFCSNACQFWEGTLDKECRALAVTQRLRPLRKATRGISSDSSSVDGDSCQRLPYGAENSAEGGRWARGHRLAHAFGGSEALEVWLHPRACFLF